MPTTGERNDPYRGFNFRVEIDGIAIASFSEVSGLTAEGDAVDYREGDESFNSVRKLMGLRKYSNITLKRGITKNMELWNWYAEIASGKPHRRNGTIILMNEAHADVLRFEFRNGWVNKIDVSHFSATGNEVVVETAEIVHEGVTIVPSATRG